MHCSFDCFILDNSVQNLYWILVQWPLDPYSVVLKCYSIGQKLIFTTKPNQSIRFSRPGSADPDPAWQLSGTQNVVFNYFQEEEKKFLLGEYFDSFYSGFVSNEIGNFYLRRIQGQNERRQGSETLLLAANGSQSLKNFFVLNPIRAQASLHS